MHMANMPDASTIKMRAAAAPMPSPPSLPTSLPSDKHSSTYSGRSSSQRRSASTTSATSLPASKNKQSTNAAATPNPMSAFVFTEYFDTLTTAEASKLAELWASTNGRLPSRRGLKEASARIGIKQSRIKRYFANQTASPAGSVLSATDVPVSSPSGRTKCRKSCCCCDRPDAFQAQMRVLETHLHCIELAILDLQKRAVDVQRHALLLEKRVEDGSGPFNDGGMRFLF